MGEISDEKNLTFRNSIIGPDIKKEGIGLFNWFINQSCESTINGYTKSIWTGVTTLTLAKAMEQAAIQNISGLYNLVNNTTITKYELLCLFNEYFRSGKMKINAIDGIRQDKSLINTRQDFDFLVPSYEEMIKEMKIWIINHPDLYRISC